MKKEAMLFEKLKDESVHCFLCAHHCRIKNNDFGFCGVRQNIDQTLYTHAYGVSIARHVDPVEKKPLYHFLPGTSAYSIGTAGCNFHCGFCQNWQISQAAERIRSGEDYGEPLMPEEVVEQALANGCRSIAYTYTEPTIFFEYAYDTSRLARDRGLRNIFVTNGFMTEKALVTIAPWLDAANVDLKAWQEKYYRDVCRGRLKPVLETIRRMKELNIWVEVTTLLIPGENDSPGDLQGIAAFIADLDADIPWHISAFHPTYRFMDRPATGIESLKQAREIGREAGLRYIYLGNVPVENHTFCPRCGEALIERKGRMVERAGLRKGRCAACGGHIPGVWK
ncbi:MAG: AmmeMemoRadiSam system radical SAM enzyme [Desulfobulbaceae bacterium]|nr:AmmeMemoRadiSam system radical SAM enzyme [Desulfobulbaceae bacterium]